MVFRFAFGIITRALRLRVAAALLSLAIGALAIQPHALAQNPAPLEFEVVSVKPNHSGSNGSIMGPPRGQRFTYINVTLQMLITVAYRVQNFQVSGGPGWLNSDRYDIVAKFEGVATTPAQQLQMLRTMLEQRFHLSVRRESKEMPIYALVTAKGKAMGKPGLNNSMGEPCPTTPAAPANAPAGQLPMPVCGQVIFGRNQLTGDRAPLSSLAAVLSTLVGRSVADRTGLTGRFDFKLDWTSDELLSDRGPEPTGQQGAAIGPSIFTALNEQMGLKLVASKGPVDVLIIDHAEKPSEDDQ